MSNLPATVPRSRILAVFDVLGLSHMDEIASLTISGTEVEVELFVGDDDGTPVVVLGEHATVSITVPVNEEA